MHLTRFTEARALYERAEAFLLAREAEHNLTLGLLTELMHGTTYNTQPPYLAAVEDDGAVVVVALMTPPHNLVLSHCNAPAALALIARDLATARIAVPGVTAPQPFSTAFAVHWTTAQGHGSHVTMAMRIYALTQVQPVQGVPGVLRRATEADRELLIVWLAAFQREAEPSEPPSDIGVGVDRRLKSTTGGFYLWEDKRPVALAGYSGPTPNGIRVGPVYTPPELRRQGYASACVAALSQMLLDQGRRFCFLFTDRSNPTSNHIYQGIGYNSVGDVDMIVFDNI